MFSIARYVFIPAIIILLGIRKYRERSWGKCTNRVKLNRKVVVVTGANSGIGFEVTKELASRGAQVIMACRDLHKASKAMYDIKKQINSSSVLIPMELDLASIKSIKTFSDEVVATYPEIHLLINNAGVSYPKHDRVKTKDGLEIHFGVNYFGHFLLTNFLLRLLRNAEGSRVVIVSSKLHENGKIHLKDLNLQNVENTDPYANSKLMNVYFCKELARRLHGSHIKALVVCPGWVYTNLFRHHNLKLYHILLSLPVAFLFMRTPKQGSQTIVYCSTQPNLLSGCIYRECQKYNSTIDFDVDISNKLWCETKRIAEQVGVTVNTF